MIHVAQVGHAPLVEVVGALNRARLQEVTQLLTELRVFTLQARVEVYTQVVGLVGFKTGQETYLVRGLQVGLYIGKDKKI